MAVEVQTICATDPVKHDDGAMLNVTEGHLFVYPANESSGDVPLIAVYAAGEWRSGQVLKDKSP